MAPKLAPAVGCLALGALTLASAALAGNGGVAPPSSATDSGEAIRDVYWFVMVFAAVVFVLVEAALILFIVRYRRRPTTPADAEGPQIHGNTRVEIIWTLVPVLLLVAIATYTFAKVPEVQGSAGGANGVEIKVQAHQFYWQYEYPNGALSFDTLYLPVGRKVTLEINSSDVDHSWWVPELTGKRDAIPGVTNFLHFTPKTTGKFTNGVCGEFCGIQHARMTTDVEVLSGAQFQQWLEANAPSDDEAALAELGQAEWSAACAKCHGDQGQGDVGPAIAGNGTLTAIAGLARLLFNGQNLEANEGYMPPVGRDWTDRQIRALMAYVQSNPKLAAEGSGGG